jgi:hypothetical protein
LQRECQVAKTVGRPSAARLAKASASLTEGGDCGHVLVGRDLAEADEPDLQRSSHA